MLKATGCTVDLKVNCAMDLPKLKEFMDNNNLKINLAVGLAMKVLEAGLVIYYTTLSHLIEDLKKAQMGHLFVACSAGD